MAKRIHVIHSELCDLLMNASKQSDSARKIFVNEVMDGKPYRLKDYNDIHWAILTEKINDAVLYIETNWTLED